MFWSLSIVLYWFDFDSVLATLVKNKVVPDPFYGLGNEAILDIADAGRDYYTFWFFTTFQCKLVGFMFSHINIWFKYCDFYINIWLDWIDFSIWRNIFISKCGLWFNGFFLSTMVDAANYSTLCSLKISIVIWTSVESITPPMFIWTGTKWYSQKECFGGILLMLLIFFIQMVITCLLFSFTLRIILGVYLLREDKEEIMR